MPPRRLTSPLCSSAPAATIASDSVKVTSSHSVAKTRPRKRSSARRCSITVEKTQLAPLGAWASSTSSATHQPLQGTPEAVM